MAKLARIALHLAIAWHALAMIAFAWPSSVVENQVRPVFETYRRFLGLSGSWKYFAPSPWGRKTFLIERDEDGRERRTDLGNLHASFEPAHSRLLTLLDSLGGKDTERITLALTSHFCRSRRDATGQAPAAVGYLIIYQRGISREELRRGDDPWSGEHVRRKRLEPKPCAEAIAGVRAVETELEALRLQERFGGAATPIGAPGNSPASHESHESHETEGSAH